MFVIIKTFKRILFYCILKNYVIGSDIYMVKLGFFYNIMIFCAFIIGFISHHIRLIDTGDFLILLMLEIGFLALINKEGDN